MRINEDKSTIQYYLLKQKEKGAIVCPKELQKKTWSTFIEHVRGKEIIIYGAGNMCEYFLNRYFNISVKYIVDKRIAPNEVDYIYNKSIYPVDKLLEEKEKTYVLISPLNDISTIYDRLKKIENVECFSLAQMESLRFENNIGIFCLKHNNSKRKKIESILARKDFQRNEIRLLKKRIKELQERQTERYKYLLHSDRVLNAVIDYLGIENLKKEQIDYYFTNKYGNEYSINWNNPQTFNEKNIRMQITEADNPLFATVTDKYEMRKYIKDVLGTDQYTLKVYGIWENEYDIELDELPSKFVIKATNGGDGNRVHIIRDKDKTDLENLRKIWSSWVGEYKGLYYSCFNGSFKNVKTRIIAEEYLEGKDEEKILDYKFWMFSGKMKLFYISEDIFDGTGRKTETKISYFLPGGSALHNVKNKIYKEMDIDRIDDRLPEMVKLAEKLSEPFEFIRVDFMVNSDRFVISELTLTPSGGMLPFDSKNIDLEIGKLWEEG